MDIEIVILHEVCQRKINIIWYHLYVGSIKGYKLTYLQKRNSVTDVENKFMLISE